MISRLVREESGMTMGLVVIMVVLIGVMGAGLLTFVSTDLNVVVEQNQGQKALEVADAGVRAARMQIRADKTTSLYRTGGGSGPWFSGNGGQNMSVDGNGVNVTIDYANSSKTYTVVSTGTVGSARRKVEAIFKADAEGWSGIQNYYSPGDIQIDSGLDTNNTMTEINGISFFSKKNIFLNDPTFTWSNSYGNTPGTSSRINIQTNSTQDVFGNWLRSPNTTPRSINTTGFAAEGRICRLTACNTSVADGVRGFDVNSNPQFRPLNPGSNGTTNITYPFNVSKIRPSDDLIQIFQDEASRQNKYYKNSLTSLDFNAVYSNSDSKRVVFLDGRTTLGGVDVAMNASAGEAQGVLIGYCVNLTMSVATAYKGTVILLIDGTCPTKGKYVSDGANLQGYVYAESPASVSAAGGPGIWIKRGSSIAALPGGFQYNSTLSDAGGARLVSWRELYS